MLRRGLHLKVGLCMALKCHRRYTEVTLDSRPEAARVAVDGERA